MPASRTITARDAQGLADRLSRRGASPTLAEQIAQLESECRLAAKLITALLRHVSPSDVFTVPSDDTRQDR